MTLDLNKLENKLDEALSNETSQTLTKFLNDKRMTNNKQQTALEWFIEELEYKGDLRETPSIRNIQLNIDTSDYMELKVQAKEMEKDEMESVIIKQCAEQSTSEASKYAEGYKEGYKRALELTQWTISNLVPPHNESNP
jgi:hypothetical protein